MDSNATVVAIAVANLGGIATVAGLAWNSSRTLASTLAGRIDRLDAHVLDNASATRDLATNVGGLQALVGRGQ